MPRIKAGKKAEDYFMDETDEVQSLRTALTEAIKIIAKLHFRNAMHKKAFPDCSICAWLRAKESR